MPLLVPLLLAAQLQFEPYALRLSDGRTVDAERATLAVPERRGAPDARSLALSVIRLRGTGPGASGAPIVYLNGSAGGAAASAVLRAAQFHPFFERLREAGDVLVVDYRGTGLSTPTLRCPRRPLDPHVFASRERAVDWFVDGARACTEALRAGGADLRGYTWAEVAEDVDDLRRGLGAARLRLVGFSSGTHLALAYLRAHPAAVERVVFLGTEGPDDTRKLPSAMERQLVAVDRLHPGFLADVDSVFARLDRAPLALDVPDSAGGVVRGTVGRFGLEFVTARSLSGPSEFDALPGLYRALAAGDARPLVRVLARLVARPPAGPLDWLLDGASGVSPARAARIAVEAPRTRLRDAANFPFPEIAAAAGVAPLPDPFRAPLASRVPALFVTGALDGNTPPDQAERVRAGFPASTHLVVEGAGHDAAWVVPAAGETVVAFLLGRDVRGARAAVPAAGSRP